MPEPSMAHALTLEGMEVLGQLKAIGNPECMVCGFGQQCLMSVLPWIFGDVTALPRDTFCNVEGQPELREESRRLGQEIANRLGGQLRM